MIGKGRCDKGLFWNPSNCEYRECREIIDQNEMISVALNDHKSVCGLCTIFIVLFVIAFLIIIGISGAFIYFHWYLKKSNTDVININQGVETVI